MIFELGGQNYARMIALENIFTTVPNFLMFAHYLTDICQKTYHDWGMSDNQA